MWRAGVEPRRDPKVFGSQKSESLKVEGWKVEKTKVGKVDLGLLPLLRTNQASISRLADTMAEDYVLLQGTGGTRGVRVKSKRRKVESLKVGTQSCALWGGRRVDKDDRPGVNTWAQRRKRHE